VLPARYRMTRSTDFGATVSQGMRAVQPDIVVHARRCDEGDAGDGGGPKVGLIVAKSVGNAVQRHRVARRLRHVARTVIADLDPTDRVVIRALPGSRYAISARLEQQLRVALKRARLLGGPQR
jgi:ribonuclease P protein component